MGRSLGGRGGEGGGGGRAGGGLYSQVDLHLMVNAGQPHNNMLLGFNKMIVWVTQSGSERYVSIEYGRTIVSDTLRVHFILVYTGQL